MGVCLQKCATKSELHGEVDFDRQTKLILTDIDSSTPISSSALQSALRGYFTRKAVFYKNKRVLGKILLKKANFE